MLYLICRKDNKGNFDFYDKLSGSRVGIVEYKFSDVIHKRQNCYTNCANALKRLKKLVQEFPNYSFTILMLSESDFYFNNFIFNNVLSEYFSF